MKKTIQRLLPILGVILPLFLQSCEETIYLDYELPVVEIARLEADQENTMKVRFTPSESVVKYEYALSKHCDMNKFIAGEMDTEVVSDNSEKEVIFDGLNEKEVYTLFVRAFDKDGKEGPVAILKDQSFPFERLKCEVNFITPTSASFTMNYSKDIMSCKYYMGKASEKEAFLKGEVDFQTLGEINETYSMNDFNLEPNTEYVLFALGIDRAGAETNLIENAFTTPTKEDAPNVELTIKSQDAFRGEYFLQGNDKCSKMTVIIHEKGLHNWEVELFAGSYKNDWMKFIKARENNKDLAVKSNKNAVNLVVPDFSFPIDTEKEILVLLYDNDGVEAGIQYFSFESAKTDLNRKPAKVDIKISDITRRGATYTYTFDENTLGFFYETVDADWYDRMKKNGEWYQFYMHSRLMKEGPAHWVYAVARKGEAFTFTENGGRPRKRYYAVACPMNFNGANQKGWAPEVLVEYKTL